MGLTDAVIDTFVGLMPQRLRAAVGRRIVETLDADRTKRLFESTSLEYRRHLQRELTAATGGVVQAGPFRGLVLPDAASSGDGDYLPKLLGFYESELHGVVGSDVAYDRIIDIGCAEGFYAVGLAMRHPSAAVLAFDSSPDAQRVCIASAARNGVGDRVSVKGTVSLELLEQLLAERQKTLLFVDCEGCEWTLLDPTRVPSLRHTDFLVECHDFVRPGMAGHVAERFGDTHTLTRLTEHGRDPNTSSHLRQRNSFARWLAVNERRPTTMEWVHGVAKP